jgi:1-acyl-sn-glycerol-3-phosphate acyltransferase
VVFPEASLKIFLTARPEVRAQRRYEELLRKNPEEAKTLDREKMQQELQKRDAFDSSREVAPLKRPDDAHVIDTSNLTIEQVVERIIQYKEKQSKGMGCFYRLIFFFCWSWSKLFYRHKVYGLEHFYPKGAIIAANHTSFLDPPLIAISWPEEVHFLARETLFRNWFFGKLIRALNAHPVSGGSGDIGVFRMACELLGEGKKVILFPEGTRAAQDQLGEIKPGVGVLVARSKTAIIPTYLKGPYEVWNRHRKFPKLFGKTVCVFGSPILWESYAHLDKKEAQDAIVHKVESSLKALRRWVEDGAEGTPP